jgi:hypothetical protein
LGRPAPNNASERSHRTPLVPRCPPRQIDVAEDVHCRLLAVAGRAVGIEYKILTDGGHTG